MHEEAPFNWLSQLSVPEEMNHVAMALIICGLLVVTTFVARMHLSRAMAADGGGLIPEPKMNYRGFFEIIAESLFKLTENVIGHHEAPTYFPVVGTLFVFIFVSNLLGLIPGLLPPTDNLNTTLALGFFVFVYYNFQGIRAHGFGYVKHFFGPIWWLAWLILPIEVVSHIFRPLSLALRLRGNIMGDHVVLHVFSGLVPYILPVIFYGLGVFVAFIQAFVFCLMTMVYISLSIAHDH
jgi:F-type H+-transporting ATPase subunit a